MTDTESQGEAENTSQRNSSLPRAGQGGRGFSQAPVFVATADRQSPAPFFESIAADVYFSPPLPISPATLSCGQSLV
jgi:hypothetical protein